MHVFNTLGRRREPFQPDGGKVGIYVCGPTVQARPHVGHGRAAVVFDVIRRYLTARGYDVTYVQNVTDVEDKIIAAAHAEGADPAELAKRYEDAFSDAYGRLGVLPPDVAPRATEHIAEMVDLVQRLIDRGHAYVSGGDVYYAVRTFAGYGKLSGKVIDDLVAGARVEPGDLKRDPLDFALWKAAKPGEPSWHSPWGEGRPGWHIECSAMAHRYLGHGFAIHGGGQDLVFPHHENEIAQSEAAFGGTFAHHWLHNGLVNLTGLKMSKSTGHFVDLVDALEEYPPLAVRLFYLRTHYRKPLDYTDEAMRDAAASLERLWAFRRRLPGPIVGVPDEEVAARFHAAMADDFDNAGALAVAFDAVREGNRLLDRTESAGHLAAALDEILDVLGLTEPGVDVSDLAGPLGVIAAGSGVHADDAAGIVDELVALRDQARTERDWTRADAIRDQLAGLGIVIEDGAGGTRWYRR